MAERLIGDKRVGDVHKLLVEDAAAIGPDQLLDELLAKIVEDPRTRHVYVLDRDGVLVGSVRLNTVLKHLFPLITSASPGHERLLDVLTSFEASTVRDIMNVDPAFVHEGTTVAETVKLMIGEQVNELPVVDNQHRVMGEVNFLEVINAYLKERKGE